MNMRKIILSCVGENASFMNMRLHIISLLAWALLPCAGAAQPLTSADYIASLKQSPSSLLREKLQQYEHGACSFLSVLQVEEAELLAQLCCSAPASPAQPSPQTNPLVECVLKRVDKGAASYDDVRQAQQTWQQIQQTAHALSSARALSSCQPLLARLQKNVQLQASLCQTRLQAGCGCADEVIVAQEKLSAWFPAPEKMP